VCERSGLAKRLCSMLLFVADGYTAMQSQAGNTALQCARQKQKTDIVRLLEAELKKKAMWSCENCEVMGFSYRMRSCARHCGFILSESPQHAPTLISFFACLLCCCFMVFSLSSSQSRVAAFRPFTSQRMLALAKSLRAYACVDFKAALGATSPHY
jgi:hypothetical protein